MSHDLFLDDVREPEWIHPSWHIEALNSLSKVLR